MSTGPFLNHGRERRKGRPRRAILASSYRNRCRPGVIGWVEEFGLGFAAPRPGSVGPPAGEASKSRPRQRVYVGFG